MAGDRACLTACSKCRKCSFFYLSLDGFFQYVIIILQREREESQGPRKWPSFICFFGVALFKTVIRLVSVDKCWQVNPLVNACQCVLGCVLCVKSKTFPQLHAIHKQYYDSFFMSVSAYTNSA